jgi:hypothetical protein
LIPDKQIMAYVVRKEEITDEQKLVYVEEGCDI